MADFWYTFKSCGAPSFLILLLAIGGFVAAIAAICVALLVHKGRLGMLAALGALIIGSASLTTGALGQMMGRSRTDEALVLMSGSSAINAEMREQIREEGYAESATCMSLGMYGGALPLLAGVLGLVAFFVRKKGDDPSRKAEE